MSHKAVPARTPNEAPRPQASGLAIAGHRVRRRWLALLAGLIAIAAIVLVAVPQFLPASSPQATIWQKITSGIADGIVPKQTALEAFAYVYKVQIPDVTVPSGVDGSDAPVSGSGAMRWVQADWDQLSAAQQAVVNGYLPPETTKGTTQMLPAPSAATVGPSVAANASSTWAFGPAALLPAAMAGRASEFDRVPGPVRPTVSSGAPKGWPFVVDVPADASPNLALAMANDMSSIIAQMGPKLGMAVIGPGPDLTPDIKLTLTDKDGGDALLATVSVGWSNGHYSPCYVTAYKNAWGDPGLTANDKVSTTLHVLLTHEVVHCYQNAAVGNVYDAMKMPSWIIEGSADYLAVDATGIVGPGDAGAWTDYLVAEVPLTNRSYDAMGYFALLAHEGRNLWGTIASAWKAAGAAFLKTNAFIAVVHGDSLDVRGNWAESYVNNPGWQDPWVMPGLGAPVGIGAPEHNVVAPAAPGLLGSLYSRSNTVLNVTATSGEVVTVATSGLASVHDQSGGHSSIAFQIQSFCTVESCVCPPGTALAGLDVASTHITIPFVAAINAPEGGATWKVIGTKLQDFCKSATPRPAPTAGPKGPCGTTCSQSNGDPHLTTVNLYRYDFQAAGEFTLLRTPDGSVDIQARQEPYTSGTAAGSVSINTAIAAKVGSHRVGVYVTSSGLVAHVDGKVADLSGGPIDLGHGGAVSAVGKGFEIDMPDGTTLWALSVGQWGINAQIHPSPALLTNGQGLLGFIVPGGMGVPALPDGTRLPQASSEAERKTVLYGKFADAWRIADSTSLFDYDPGKSTASYTVRPYPTNTSRTTVADLSTAERDAGRAACAAVTDPALQEECVFDAGVTGDKGFAGAYVATQTLYDGGVAEASPSPTARTSAAPATPGATTGNFFTVTPIADLGGFAQGPDNTVYLSTRTADNVFSLIAFDPVAGKIVKQVSVPALASVHVAAGSVWLPGLVTDANGHNCNVTRFDVTTLAQQALIQIPCTFNGGPGAVASDGAAVWFADTTKFDLGSGKGAVMTRIDPATNAPGAAAADSVALPFVNGITLDSQGAFFYSGDSGYLVHAVGAGDFTSLGKFATVPHAAGAGLWTLDSTGKSAQYFTAAGTPQATVQIGGNVVAGDTSAAYTEVLGNDPTTGTTEEQLWRYPIDGSTPTQIATAPEIGGQGNFLSYFGDPMPQDNGHGVLKIWVTRDTTGQRVLVLQWTPVAGS